LRATASTTIAAAWLFFAASALADPPAPDSILIEGRATPVMRDASSALLVNAGCRKSSGQLRCRAYDALRSASVRRLEGRLAGGAYPGAVLCTEQARGALIHARIGAGDDFVCRFSDGSFTALYSLHAFALANDKKPGR
jgi:hypothetical protein